MEIFGFTGQQRKRIWWNSLLMFRHFHPLGSTPYPMRNCFGAWRELGPGPTAAVLREDFRRHGGQMINAGKPQVFGVNILDRAGVVVSGPKTFATFDPFVALAMDNQSAYQSPPSGAPGGYVWQVRQFATGGPEAPSLDRRDWWYHFEFLLPSRGRVTERGTPDDWRRVMPNGFVFQGGGSFPTILSNVSGVPGYAETFEAGKLVGWIVSGWSIVFGVASVPREPTPSLDPAAYGWIWCNRRPYYVKARRPTMKIYPWPYRPDWETTFSPPVYACWKWGTLPPLWHHTQPMT